MYFEIYKNGNLIKRGDDVLNDLEWENELMYVPTLTLTLPITYHDYISGREEIKIFVNDKCFWGIVVGITENKAEEIMDIDINHVIHEWTYRQISMNNAIKDKSVNIVYKGSKKGTKGKETISASPFNMLINEVGSFTNKKYIKRAGASAWTSDGEKVDVTGVDHSKVIVKPGTYDVVFSTANGAKVTVKATVKRIEGTQSRKKDNVTVSAVPFEVHRSDVSGLTTADYISKAYAIAYTSEGEEVPISSVDHSKVQAVVGAYDVTYQAQNTKLTIKINVVRDSATIKEPDIPDYSNVNAEASVIDQLEDIFSDVNFAYPGWDVNMSDEAADTLIDYVYSRQNKLDALTKTVELTEDLFWRVRFVNEKVVDISEFGDKKDWIISLKPSGNKNISIIEEPTIEHDFENVINVATVYSEKSDSGMSSLTLREVYNDPDLQKDKFPCVILRSNVNNERDYTRYSYQYPKLAPNNEVEYAIVDEESIALESGAVIEGTFAFNDLAPFNDDKDSEGKTREIKDTDRIKAAKTAYKAAVRKLKQSRRRFKITVVTEELPAELAPGDRVRFIYDNSLYILDACSSYMKKILSYNDWFYITAISYSVSGDIETNTVTLEKYLRIERDISNE